MIDEYTSSSLSKRLSYILRHNPDRFNVSLDKEGWTNIDGILDTLHNFPDLIDLKKKIYFTLYQAKQREDFKYLKIK